MRPKRELSLSVALFGSLASPLCSLGFVLKNDAQFVLRLSVALFGEVLHCSQKCFVIFAMIVELKTSTHTNNYAYGQKHD